jgi:hypothetical protein
MEITEKLQSHDHGLEHCEGPVGIDVGSYVGQLWYICGWACNTGYIMDSFVLAGVPLFVLRQSW